MITWRLPLSGASAEVERNQPIMRGDRAASLTQGCGPLLNSAERAPTPKPQCTGQELRPLLLPPGKAQAACCRLCVAPRTLSFKSSSGMHGLVSSILPQSHVALRKNSETRETADPALAASLPVGMDWLDSWAVSRHPHLRQKRIHTQISREMIKSRFLLTAMPSAHGGSLYLGEKKIISSAVSIPHILEPRSCKILAFSLGSLVVPYGVLCSSLETTQRNSA